MIMEVVGIMVMEKRLDSTVNILNFLSVGLVCILLKNCGMISTMLDKKSPAVAASA